MSEPFLTFRVYRFSEAGNKPAFIGPISARIHKPDAGERAGLAARGLDASLKLVERLFTVVRPGDILLGANSRFRAIAVDENIRGLPYSVIYVQSSEAGEKNAC